VWILLLWNELGAVSCCKEEHETMEKACTDHTSIERCDRKQETKNRFSPTLDEQQHIANVAFAAACLLLRC